MKARRSFCFPAVNEAGRSCWTLGGQLGVAGWGETPAQVLEDVQRQAADQCDDGHLPQERHCGDEVYVWHRTRVKCQDEMTGRR